MHCVLFGKVTSSDGPSPSLGNPEQENPNPVLLRRTPPCSPQPQPQLSSKTMALQRADPTPFLPRGMQWQQIQNRPPVVHAVAVRPRHHNEDLAIVTIEPFPGNLVSSQNIREVVREFLVDHKRLEIVDIPPCHLGQAYVTL